MKRKAFILIPVLTAALFIFSCFRGNKYKPLQDTSRQYMDEGDQYRSYNIGLEMANREMEAKLAVLEKQLGTLKEDVSKAQVERDRALDDFNKISSKYTELQNAQEDLIRGNVKETQNLLSELQKAQQALQEPGSIATWESRVLFTTGGFEGALRARRQRRSTRRGCQVSPGRRPPGLRSHKG